MPEIERDITHANKANICFKNRLSLRSISTIQVFILACTINFYVVNIFISFFFYLKDIDIFNIYSNNITNQLIY